jgi:hypothetical protein
MDQRLHAERRAAPWACRFRDLPDASIFATGGQFCLKAGKDVLAWEFDGYRQTATSFDPDETVRAVTPPTIRAVLSAGYCPRLHPSARIRS